MVHQYYFSVLLGGLLVGIAAGRVLLANRRVAGASEMVSNVRPSSADAPWQALFLVGLVAGGIGLAWLDPAALPAGESIPLQLMIGAGLLVGFVARVGFLADITAQSKARRSICGYENGFK